MDIRYPGPTGSFPARATEPAPEPTTIIALCDGSVTRVKAGDWQAVMHANAVAADLLVERIAKRVVDMTYALQAQHNARYG